MGRNRRSPSPQSHLLTSLKERDADRRARLKRLSQSPSAPPRLCNDLLPVLRLIQLNPNLLIYPTRNVRAIDQDHIKEVVASVSALGFNVPILIDGNKTVIDGVIRSEAAKALGLETVPCVVVDAPTPSQLKLLRLAANRLAEKGRWDLNELKIEFEELIVSGEPIEIAGFELVEIDGVLTEIAPLCMEAGPLGPATDAKAISKRGDVYCCGPHRIICGDATDPKILARLMDGHMAQLVFTDQPYNVPVAGHVTGGRHREFEMASGEMTDLQFRAFNDAWIVAASSHLADGGLLGTYIDWRGIHSVTSAAIDLGFSQLNLVIWAKTNAGMGSLYRSQHEMLPIFKKGDAPHVNNVNLGQKAGRWRSNVWTYAGASSIGSEARKGLETHPTVKPIDMLSDALLDLTNRGALVLDPFLGSGSTLIAAEKTGRICMGVEIDPVYLDVVLVRYENATGTSAILEETGEQFAAVKARRAEDRLKALSASRDTNRESPRSTPRARIRDRS